MVSKEEFRNYAKTIADNNKEDIKRDFKKSKKSSPIFIFLFFVFFVVSIFSISSGSIDVLFFLIPFVFIFTIIIFIFNIIMNTSRNKNYISSTYKTDVIDYLLKNYDYSYDKDGGIDSSEYDKSPMYSSYDKYDTEDYLKINLSKDVTHKSDCWLSICDLHTYREVRKEVSYSFGDEDNSFHSYETRKETVFDGSFGYIQFNDSFKTNLYINCPSYSYMSNVEYVKLEDINFNKKFVVYSGDQVEARYILNPRIMELINELNNKVNGCTTKVRRVISIALVGNRMYFTFSGGFKLFELNRYYKDTSEIFDDFYDDMEIILKLVEEIQNNNKIFKI